MQIPLALGHYKNGAINGTECVNMMVEADAQGGSAPYVLVNTPGNKPFVNLGKTGQGRGGYSYPGFVIAVVSRYLFVINTVDKTFSLAGTLKTSTGFLTFAENPSQIMLTDGTYGYIVTKETGVLTRIVDPDFPVAKACTYKDGYGIVIERDTGKFFVSGINDFTAWNALDFTTAEFEPDNLVACKSNHDSVFAFGVETTQAYLNSGNITFPFDNRPGATMTIGCGATFSPALGNNVIFWLDNHGEVRLLAGYSPQIISTPQISRFISGMSVTSDATGHTYTQDGHTFYVLNFPTDKKTLVYDMSTAQWHTRESYASNGRYRPAWIVQDGNLVLAGDFENGMVYEVSSTVYSDNERFQNWRCTLQNVNSDRKPLIHVKLELHIEAGVGLENNDDPELWMEYSDDDGFSWSHQKWASMGKVGERMKRVVWRALGRSRSRVYRIGGSDAVKRTIISAHLEAKQVGY